MYSLLTSSIVLLTINWNNNSECLSVCNHWKGYNCSNYENILIEIVIKSIKFIKDCILFLLIELKVK